MKGTDIECTTIECILPWVMRNWAGCKKLGVVGYTSSDIDLVCTTTGYTRPISQLLGTLAVIWILCTQPLGRGATEQSTLAERGEFHKNSTPILRVDYSCTVYITTYRTSYVF